MKIFGVEILNEGSGVSIDDAVTEMQATFVARYVEPWQIRLGASRRKVKISTRGREDWIAAARAGLPRFHDMRRGALRGGRMGWKPWPRQLSRAGSRGVETATYR